MKAYPAADLFPLMEGQAFAEFIEDIRTNGQREPIILHTDGSVLDGRNRLRACEAAGVEPQFETWDGEGDPVAFVVSLNLHRRHLNESQRAMIAAKLATMEQGARTDLASIEAKSQTEAADMLNVSRSSVQRAKVVQDKGVEEVVDEVMAGVLSVAVAENIAREPEAKQKEIMRTPPSARNTGRRKAAVPEEPANLRKQTVLMALEQIADAPITPSHMASIMFDVERSDVRGILPEIWTFLDTLEKEMNDHDKNAA